MLLLRVCMLSCVRFFKAPWTAACQAPLPTEFSRQEHWSGLPFPSAGDLLDPGMEPASPASPALAGRFFTTALPLINPVMSPDTALNFTSFRDL